MKKFKRFSLVELLIVMAVFSILLSLLNPALRRALDGAKSIQCGGQLKTISQSVFQFVDDHNGYLPNGYFNNEAYPQWWVKLSSYTTNDGTLSQRLPLYTCPNATYRANLIEFPYTYSCHPQVMPGQDEVPTGVRPESLKRPSEIMLIGDADQVWTSTGDCWLTFKNPSQWLYTSSAADGDKTIPIYENQDFNPGAQNFLRYRHLNETNVNTMMVDGGVQSFLMGTVVQKNISNSY